MSRPAFAGQTDQQNRVCRRCGSVRPTLNALFIKVPPIRGTLMVCADCICAHADAIRTLLTPAGASAFKGT